MKACLWTLSALWIASTGFAAESLAEGPQDHSVECRSIIEPLQESTSSDGKRTVFEGHYFTKNQRSVGFVDTPPFRSASAYWVQGVVHNGQEIEDSRTLMLTGTGVGATWETENVLEMIQTSYDPDTGEYGATRLPGGIEFKRFTVFCGESPSEIRKHIEQAYPSSRTRILPFSSGPWMTSANERSPALSDGVSKPESSAAAPAQSPASSNGAGTAQ